MSKNKFNIKSFNPLTNYDEVMQILCELFEKKLNYGEFTLENKNTYDFYYKIVSINNLFNDGFKLSKIDYPKKLWKILNNYDFTTKQDILNFVKEEINSKKNMEYFDLLTKIVEHKH
jgi:hypothetical protein